jgi:hypothetical protein
MLNVGEAESLELKNMTEGFRKLRAELNKVCEENAELKKTIAAFESSSPLKRAKTTAEGACTSAEDASAH